ncbi:hypothetical protein NKH10_17650 [Mesorhizobium sp. M1340]|uniref:hypothetical protein n=1 Tax=unclassified Mesorhizobium TaxID=325217 RepID=UPI003339120C
MSIAANFSIKELAETKPGELVRLRGARQSVLAFVLGPRPQNRFGVLTLEPAPPHLTVPSLLYPAMEKVTSFGSDWVLEIIDGIESSVGNRDYHDIGGVIFVGKITTITARNPDRFGDLQQFDLNSWAEAEWQHEEVPAPHWRLWANQSEKDRHNGIPLMDFDARKEKPPR